MCRGWNASQPAALVIRDGLPDLFLRVHDEGSVAGDRLGDRLPVHDEHGRVRRRLDRDLAAFALEYDELAFVHRLAVHRYRALQDEEGRGPAFAQVEARAMPRAQAQVEQV